MDRMWPNSDAKYGSVYILENINAKRVKVGLTYGSVKKREGEINSIWLGRQVTCQICGERRVISKGLMPEHYQCHGGRELPAGRSIDLAKSEMLVLKQAIKNASHPEKILIRQKIKALRIRIHIYSNYPIHRGIWIEQLYFKTTHSFEVEQLSHKVLHEFLDDRAPMGEVFMCSVKEAETAITRALQTLGLDDKVKKVKIDHEHSFNNGACVICGGPVTQKHICFKCMLKYNP